MYSTDGVILKVGVCTSLAMLIRRWKKLIGINGFSSDATWADMVLHGIGLEICVWKFFSLIHKKNGHSFTPGWTEGTLNNGSNECSTRDWDWVKMDAIRYQGWTSLSVPCPGFFIRGVITIEVTAVLKHVNFKFHIIFILPDKLIYLV